MLPIVKSEIKTVSYVETPSKTIKIPSFKVSVQSLKISGIFISLLLIFVVLTSLKSPQVVERNLEQEFVTAQIQFPQETEEEENGEESVKIVKVVKDKTEISQEVRAKALLLLKEKWNPQLRKFHKKGKKGQFNQQSGTVIDKNIMLNYVPDFIVEEVLTNVPCLASITAAQADIEGQWWTSGLAQSTNNNFGIKQVKKWDKDPETWLGQYRDGHKIAHDDIPTDKFIRFTSKWACIRFHTKFLTLLHYKKHIGKDFKGWAIGLRTSGYATDKGYTNALINRYKVLDLKTVESIAYQLRQEYK